MRKKSKHSKCKELKIAICFVIYFSVPEKYYLICYRKLVHIGDEYYDKFSIRIPIKTITLYPRDVITGTDENMALIRLERSVAFSGKYLYMVVYPILLLSSD